MSPQCSAKVTPSRLKEQDRDNGWLCVSLRGVLPVVPHRPLRVDAGTLLDITVAGLKW